MKLSEFSIGKSFWAFGAEWRCTDKGSRTVLAIELSDKDVVRYTLGPPEKRWTEHLSRAEAEKEGWFKGPPYAVVEKVFDETELPACYPSRDEAEAARKKVEEFENEYAKGNRRIHRDRLSS
jgi:hypothetical protein